MNTSIRRANVIFLAALLVCLSVCVAGPLSVIFARGGAWLFVWPLAFWIVRFLAFFIFPFAAVVLIYLKCRKAFGGSLMYVNAALVVALASSVWVTESWAKSGANSASAKQFGSASSAQVLNREFGAQSLPALPLLDSNGRPVDVREGVRKGRVTLLVFFATYDISWSDNIKMAGEIHNAMATNGVQVIGIDEQESQATVSRFTIEQKLDFPIFRDSDGKYLRLVGGLGSVEQMLVVNSSGKVIARRSRGSESLERVKEALVAQIKQ